MTAGGDYELHLDGQTVGRFAAAAGLEDDADLVHLPGLRRAQTVELTDGHIADEYSEWLEYGRSQVGKHGEITGLGADGSPTRWVFEEGWPTRAVRARRSSQRGLALSLLRLEIEGVVATFTDSASPVAAAAVLPTARGVPPDGRAGFWRRLFRRMRPGSQATRQRRR